MKTLASHARIYGSPGTRVRILGLFKSLWPLILVVLGLGYLIRAAVPAPALSTSVTGLLFLILAVTVAAATNYSRDRLQNYLKGARGEESVARELSRLPEGYNVFHGIAAAPHGILAQGGADLDHVVVGPNGVVVIETKNWSGDITVSDNHLLCDNEPPDRDPLEQVKNAAATLHDRLRKATGSDIAVTPVLCFAQGCILKGLTAFAGVIICSEDRLCAIIRRHHSDTPLSDERQAFITHLLMQDIET